METVPAWDLIGHEGKFRIAGGRKVYEAVMRNEATARGDRSVRLCYLATDGGLRQVNRWVDADTPIEISEDFERRTPITLITTTEQDNEP